MKKRLGLLFFLLLFLISLFLPTPYHLLKPGVALPLKNNIQIEGETYFPEGSFLLTAVSTERASLLEIIYYFLFSPKEMDLVRIYNRLPEGVEMEDYVELMAQLMEESKLTAQVVALDRVGEEASVTGEGAEVVEVLKDSKAIGVLEPGDVIFHANGQNIYLATELVQLVDGGVIGQEIEIGVKRGEEPLYFSVSTREFPDRPGRPSIGILIRSHELKYHFSRDIHIKTDGIIGPSAGLMFTLEIINQLTKEDITHGLHIAGTGTIDIEGKIGPIDGVIQKVYSAQKRGASIFLLPLKNQEDLFGHQFSLKIIAVESIDEILEMLNNGSLSEVFSWKALSFSLEKEAIEITG